MLVANCSSLPLLLLLSLLPSLVHPFLLPAATTISSPSRASPLRMAATKGMVTVDVSLGDRSYPIYIGPGLLKQPELLTQHVAGKRCMVITNDVRLSLILYHCKYMHNTLPFSLSFFLVCALLARRGHDRSCVSDPFLSSLPPSLLPPQLVGPLYLKTTDAILATSTSIQQGDTCVLPDGKAYKHMPTLLTNPSLPPSLPPSPPTARRSPLPKNNRSNPSHLPIDSTRRHLRAT